MDRPSSRTVRGSADLSTQQPYTPVSTQPAQSRGTELAGVISNFVSNAESRRLLREFTSVKEAVERNIATFKHDVEKQLESFRRNQERRDAEADASQQLNTAKLESLSASQSQSQASVGDMNVFMNQLEQKLEDVAKDHEDQIMGLSTRFDTELDKTNLTHQAKVTAHDKMLTNFEEREREYKNDIYRIEDQVNQLKIIQSTTAEKLRIRLGLSTDLIDFVQELMTHKKELGNLFDTHHASSEQGHPAYPQIINPSPEYPSSPTRSSDYLSDDEVVEGTEPEAQPESPPSSSTVGGNKTTDDVGENQGSEIENGRTASVPGATRLEVFRRHVQEFSSRYRRVRPKSDTRFIWSFLNGIEDREYQRYVELRLLDAYSTVVRQSRKVSKHAISIDTRLTWKQVVQLLQSTKIPAELW